MPKDETYFFHQTPEECCKKLLTFIPFEEGDVVLEPFKGEGSFYNNFPDNCIKQFCEIEEGLDYKDYSNEFDWVISNPPFRLEQPNGKRVNSFYFLLEYYTAKAKKGIAFLANDYCLSTITPIRLKKLNERGWYITKIVVCSIKKWRGRYFFIILTKTPNNFYQYLEGNL